MIFLFHQNREKEFDSDNFKLKIRPPRLNGKKKSLYATRSPHRVNKIGLSLSKIERIEDSTIYLSEVDLIDGTPIIDISKKIYSNYSEPYIPLYDSKPDAKFPKWIQNESEIKLVEFTEESLQILKESVEYQEFYKSYDELKEAIVQVLQLDPRGISYKLNNDTWYAFYMDNLNVIVNVEKNIARVEKIEVIKDWEEIIKAQNEKVLEMKKQK